MGFRKEKEEPKSLEEYEEMKGRKFSFRVFLICLVGYIVYQIFVKQEEVFSSGYKGCV